ncbi:hypothetical protein SCHPADRAFT_911442 [Schizopora paradoxa]|uniref:Uncharacterized protein n=1 Tax=Schizopora paradoxa TaxID=27342 RepID=A0A0H2R5L4_9AGAM|nr:hypothetical protein SCHPADRAFT_911442 [Schizopora paradoxa]
MQKSTTNTSVTLQESSTVAPTVNIIALVVFATPLSPLLFPYLIFFELLLTDSASRARNP